MTSYEGHSPGYDAAQADALRGLIDENPSRAIESARGPRPAAFHEINWDLLRAGVLVDAGQVAGDRDAVIEGEKLLRGLSQLLPGKPDVAYSLANGVEASTRLDSTPYPGWYRATGSRRAEARALLTSVTLSREGAEQDLRARAFANLGNLLSRSFRWAEAYDAYAAALRLDPSNGVAAGSAAQMLRHMMKAGAYSRAGLDQVARYYASRAQGLETRVHQLAGPDAVAAFRALPALKEPWEPLQPSAIKDPYLQFVASHRLALVPTIEGFDATQRRWDVAGIASVRLAPDAGPQVPALFAMFNLLKADFAAARALAYQATATPHPDDGLYVDTLDYGVYGQRTSLLVLAQRAALDLLDRVAVCANAYLASGLLPTRVNYRMFWWTGEGPGRVWRKEVSDEIEAGNVAAVALADLADDLTPAGALRGHIDARNAGTHRFLVLHDIALGDSATSPAVEHEDYGRFFDIVVATLQLARSAVLYLGELIALREQRICRKDGAIGTLFAPPHHHIRGQE